MIPNPSKLLSVLLGLFVCGMLSAQVPSMLNYQGRIAVSGVNFDGTGLFKFALVNTNGTQTFWSNDGTSTAGSEPTAAVSIDVDSGIYSVRLGDTALPNMTAVPATVFANPDVRLRVWFNDGVNGSQLMSPDQRIAAVGYAMMANTVQDGAITSAKIANGAVGSAQLATGAVTSALQAANVSAVAAGGIIGSNDPNNAALLAQGFVRDAGQLSTADSWTELPGGDAVAGHTAVWTGTELIFWGGVVPSGTTGGAGPAVTAINRGTKYNPTTGVWTAISTQGAPQARFGHTAVWTGTEMIVFGGQTTATSGSGTVLNTGGRYNPATNTWSFLAPLISPPSMPDNRRDHFAFWTGSKMLVWGGSNSGDYFGATNPPNHNTQGKVYDAAANTWSDMAMSPPEITSGTFAAVWTGTEMILWGGQNSSANPPRAGRYDPATDTWQIPASIPGDPMLPQSGFTATWSGTEMIVWGGGDGATQFNSGYRYNPGANTWTTMTTTGAPETRYRHTATWVGSELVIWGGKGGSGPSAVNFTNGGRYDPTTDTWTSIADTSSIAARQFASSSAVAGQLIVWGGAFSASDPATVFKFHKNGGRLTPATSAWTTLATGSPAPRAGHSLIWTGTELIVWGGTVSTNTNIGFDPTFNDGARFNPATGVWTPLPSTNAPLGRYGHSAVWTGTEMIIFGGQRINATSMNETLNTGARYHPGTDTWTATDTATAPSARSRHTAVWTGSKMIVWGGTTDGNSMNTNTGAVYDPGTNAWTATTTMGGPMQGSSQHYAFWTGTDMILLGEQGSMGVNHRYNPTTDSWTANASNMSLPPMNLRSTSAAQWTGSDILVSYYQTGPFQIQSYSPVANFWQALTSGSSLTTTSPSSVWTGSDMIVFGLTTFTTPTFQAARFTPATGTWTNISTTGGPTRQIGSAVWTGSEMILWGGRLGTGPGNETSVHDIGSRYRLPQNYYFYRRP